MFFCESVLTNILVLIFFIALLIFFVSSSSEKYWQSLGIKYLPLTVIFKIIICNYFKPEKINNFQKSLYDYFEGCPLGGVPSLKGKAVIIRDPELIEYILIKDFSTFVNHGIKMDTELDPLSKFLFNLENIEWKRLRTKMSPNFTTSKLKDMQEQLIESSDKLLEYLSKIEEKQIEIKSALGKFAIDFIGCSAFGLTTNAFSEESVYVKMANILFNPSLSRGLASTIAFVFPKLGKIFRLKMFPQCVDDFFMNVVKETSNYREANNIKRKDLFQSLTDIRKNELNICEDQITFDFEAMTANCFGFLVGGFDTISGTSSFLLYELALNSEIQLKIYQEIVDVMHKFNDELTYEAVKEMTYLSNALSETLRKYPPAFFITRRASRPYLVPNSSAIIPNGTQILLPVLALHTDSQYFPNPEKFDPDRFSAGSHIPKGTYLPFGDGPRMCIASRLAQLEIKVVVTKILLKYKVSLGQDLKQPLEFKSGTWNVKGGLQLKLDQR